MNRIIKIKARWFCFRLHCSQCWDGICSDWMNAREKAKAFCKETECHKIGGGIFLALLMVLLFAFFVMVG